MNGKMHEKGKEIIKLNENDRLTMELYTIKKLVDLVLPEKNLIKPEYYNVPIEGMCPHYPSCESTVVYWFYNQKQYPTREMLIYCEVCESAFLVTLEDPIEIIRDEHDQILTWKKST